MVGSLTGVVASKSVTEASKGALSRPTEDGKEGALLNLPRFFGKCAEKVANLVAHIAFSHVIDGLEHR